MAHVTASRHDPIRLRSKKMGWGVVGCVGRRRGKVRGMGVSGHTRKYKYGKGSRLNIKDRPEEDTG